MIATHLIRQLKEAFPEVPFQFSETVEGQPAVTLPSPCAEVGALEIHDDEYEATVYLTHISHGHFGCYEEGLTEDERAREIASDVVDFVRALLADRVVLFSSLGGRIGGWRLLGADEAVPKSSLLARRFLWSVPL